MTTTYKNEYTGTDIKQGDLLSSIESIEYTRLDKGKANFLPLVGSRSFKTAPDAATEEIYADGKLFTTIDALSSLSVDAEFVTISNRDKVNIWNLVYDEKTGAIITDGNRQPHEVAVLVTARYVGGRKVKFLYPKVKFERIANSVETQEKSPKPQFTQVKGKALPIDVDSMSVTTITLTDVDKLDEAVAAYVQTSEPEKKAKKV